MAQVISRPSSRLYHQAAALLALAVTVGIPARADQLTCTLDNAVAVVFEIDRNQFVAARDPNDPPRRKITTVRMGAAQFPAEPILMGDLRGFWAEGWAGSDVMFVVQPDGSAVYTDTNAGERLTGTCDITP